MSAIRDTILNNYLATYSPSITRYDTHKKSELRSTYNSIVKLNKESPWYLPVTSKDTQAYAISLKENARELRGSIAELGGLEEDGLLDKKSAFSSQPAIVTAQYIGTDQDAASAPSFEMEVKQLASPQINSGILLPEEATHLPEDTYSFDVGINDMNYEFQFSVSEGETNRNVQNRLARLINNSGIGLSAEVVEQDGASALRITSDATGLSGHKKQIFSITDDRTSKTSGSVAYFGLDHVSSQASNAEFSINGEPRSSSSNHFTVGKMYELNLQGVSEEGSSATIGIKTNTESVTDNVTRLIGSYNEFVKSVSSYMDSQSRSSALLGELSGMADYYGDSLSELGIRLTEDGTMEVDSEKIKSMADASEDLKSTFGVVKDFSNALLRKSNQISLNPMEYVKRTVVAYKNPGHNFASPYNSSSYSGMMFNFYC